MELRREIDLLAFKPHIGFPPPTKNLMMELEAIISPKRTVSGSFPNLYLAEIRQNKLQDYTEGSSDFRVDRLNG